jgi:manganese-dependent inorganic pyrophosphatase
MSFRIAGRNATRVVPRACSASFSSAAEPIKVFGHKIPDTDTVCSAMVREWDLKQQGVAAQAYRLGELNKETAYVLDSLSLESPPLLTEPLTDSTVVSIVDTNNPAELPENVETAVVHSIIDHHKMAGLTTAEPLEIDMRPLCSAGSILYARMKTAGVTPTPAIAGLMLSCILSDSLEFRSPTTTDVDREYASELQTLSGLDSSAHAAAMFKAKADIEDLTAADVVLSDSKVFEVQVCVIMFSMVL